MFKALELIGFKSFADKTRFEFPTGVTAIVGPNGSGKSNVVDAIKWVLGEQSVKSLRGKEMADVIFNGSGSRPPMNSAETTLTFDNSKRLLAIDTPEVHITRRVYRSGEGEYLINRQPCRLRDIRELFSGTGVATEAYSVIEQGKVDVMLQSSPKDRRMIFEEAAGISRFKAKKLECQRRLERVDQNMLRLSDIVTEVEGRLRSVRMQASKAKRYTEHSDRLQQLRTQVALADWSTLTGRLESLEAETATIIAERQQAAAQAEALHAQLAEYDSALQQCGDAIRQSDARASDVRQTIATHTATIEHHHARLTDLQEELQRHRNQLRSMSIRVGDVRLQLHATTEAMTVAQAAHVEVELTAALRQTQWQQASQEAETARGRAERARVAHLEQTRTAAMLVNEVAALQAQVEAATQTSSTARRRLDELEQSTSAQRDSLEAGRSALEQLAHTVESLAGDLAEATAGVDVSRQQLNARNAELSQLRARQSGASERARVLEELEHRFEGLNSGVKEIILGAREVADGPFRHVKGLVADLLRASVEMAPVIDAVLGERSQYLVVTDDRDLLAFLELQTYRLKGRVGFFRVPRPGAKVAESPFELEGQPGVVGRADRFVEVAPAYEPLACQLLGSTWIVEKLSHARQLAAGAGRGCEFVTLAGEVLTSEGLIAVGPHGPSAALVSRRSELRALRQLTSELDSNVAATSAAVMQLSQLLESEEQRVRKLTQIHAKRADELAKARYKAGASEARLAQLDEQREQLATEAEAASAQLAQSSEALTKTETAKHACESELARLEVELEQLWSSHNQLAAELQTAEQALTEAKVNLAKSEERLANLAAQQQQLQRDQQERDRTLAELRQRAALAEQRSRESESVVLASEAALADAYLLKEHLADEAVQLVAQLANQRTERSKFDGTMKSIRSQERKLDEQLRKHELAAGEVRHERTTLAERLREDYDLDLATLSQELTPEELEQRESIEQEIAELRRKMQHIGNINLDALEEADSLESRFESLSQQHSDLLQAKAQLEQIITKINTDSRRLFGETLETVKVHFQALFRKLFGGGQADIVLEEGVDMLESGIEIVARPPGKEPRSISLLSGGEKTMTCVALLLAIFQYRPSPFCVLDEVDAALDEANIERFTAVLQEFLAWTQFIVVTHSKKTMTCASTLYGVTMQESGISKRVAVRFEDVTDNGEIRQGSSADEQAA